MHGSQRLLFGTTGGGCEGCYPKVNPLEKFARWGCGELRCSDLVAPWLQGSACVQTPLSVSASALSPLPNFLGSEMKPGSSWTKSSRVGQDGGFPCVVFPNADVDFEICVLELSSSSSFPQCLFVIFFRRCKKKAHFYVIQF